MANIITIMYDPGLDLVKKAQAGDKEALGKLFDKYSSYVYKLTLWTLKQHASHAEEDAQEIQQEVFLSLIRDNFKRLKSFRFKSKFSTWLATVTINTTFNYMEKQKRYREKLIRLESEKYLTFCEPVESLTRNEAAKNVKDAMRQLPPRDRLLLELFYIDGLSYTQIARLLNLAEGSISPLLIRARQKLFCILTQSKSV